MFVENMKAMILAAGLGTRLRPLTDMIPKALVKYKGTTLLEHAIRHLGQNGVKEIIVNVHHHAEQVIDFLNVNKNFGMNITISDETGQLLDTGGGLKKAGWFFTGSRPFIVRNVDIISDLDLRKVHEHHSCSGAMTTLVVRSRETSRYLLFDSSGLLCGWENRITGEKIITRQPEGKLRSLAFSGIQVISPEIFDLITEEGTFPVIGLFLRLSGDHKIVAFTDNNSVWLDVGKNVRMIDD